MRQGAPQKRGRGRPGGRRGHGNPLNRTYDSSGPDVKVRGTAMTIYEKYQVLARDASASGDRIAAENYLQHAEHYYRLMQAAKTANQAQQPGQNQAQNNGPRDNRGESGETQREDDAPAAAGGEAREPAAPPPAAAPPAPAPEPSEEQPAEAPLRAPMSPAALVAEVAANEGGRGGNGADQSAAGDDGNGEDAPRRAPRRRRRPPKAADSGEQPETPSEAPSEI